jgi:hypothetical protein
MILRTTDLDGLFGITSLLWTGSSGELLYTWKLAFGLHKKRKMSSVAEQLLDAQEWLSSVELVTVVINTHGDTLTLAFP